MSPNYIASTLHNAQAAEEKLKVSSQAHVVSNYMSAAWNLSTQKNKRFQATLCKKPSSSGLLGTQKNKRFQAKLYRKAQVVDSALRCNTTPPPSSHLLSRLNNIVWKQKYLFVGQRQLFANVLEFTSDAFKLWYLEVALVSPLNMADMVKHQVGNWHGNWWHIVICSNGSQWGIKLLKFFYQLYFHWLTVTLF